MNAHLNTSNLTDPQMSRVQLTSSSLPLQLFDLSNVFSVKRTEGKKKRRAGRTEQREEKRRKETTRWEEKEKEVKRSRAAAGRCQESQRTICPSSAISTHTHTHATLNFLPHNNMPRQSRSSVFFLSFHELKCVFRVYSSLLNDWLTHSFC